MSARWERQGYSRSSARSLILAALWFFYVAISQLVEDRGMYRKWRFIHLICHY